MTTRALPLSLALLAGLAPTAAAQNAVSFTDACGDVGGFARVNERRVDLPVMARDRAFDVSAVTVESTGPRRVRVALTMCAAVGDPDTVSFRGGYARLSDGCSLAIAAEDRVVAPLARRPVLIKTCFAPSTGPLDDGSDRRFEIELPAAAITVSGPTLAIDVDGTAFTGEAAAAIAPGSRWTGLTALGALGGTTSGGGFDTNGNSEAFSAPGRIDFATTNEELVLR